MNDSMDKRLRELLREDAPPARDAGFRMALVERRQRQLYRQQAWRRAIAFALLAVVPGLVLHGVGHPLVTTLVVVGVGGLVLSGLRAISATRHACRWALGAVGRRRLR